MRHEYSKWIFALAVGVGLSIWAYRVATNPEPARRKALEISVAQQARDIVSTYVDAATDLQYVDPLQPNHKIGDSYILPADQGWQVSGYYRRQDDDQWHPFLVDLTSESELTLLSVKDANDDLIRRAMLDPLFSAIP